MSDAVLHAVFNALHRHKVVLEGIVLKPSMVLPGNKNPSRATPEQVAAATLAVLRRNVPASVPTINFLSGGQSPEDATANLNAMNVMYPKAPWVLSFSYARALQDPAMRTWAGRKDNVSAAQSAFHRRLKMNSLARAGKWSPEIERAGWCDFHEGCSSDRPKLIGAGRCQKIAAADCVSNSPRGHAQRHAVRGRVRTASLLRIDET